MTKVTEKDIIEYLEKRLNYLYAETKRIQAILSIINDTPSYQTENFQNEYPITPFQTGSKGNSNSFIKNISHKSLPVPESYRPSLALSRKIAYALSLIKTGFKEDIVRQINKLQPELDPAFITKQITTVLSELKAQKLLTAIKVGRKYEYSLTETIE